MIRPYLFVAAIATLTLFAALPLSLIRGLTRAKWPPYLLLGYSASEWTLAETLVGIGLAVTVAVPAFVFAIVLLGSPGQLIALGLPLLAVACGLSVALGWMVPSGVDDPLGQAFSTFTLFISVQIIELVFGQVFHAGSAVWGLSLLLLGSLGIATATLVERRRWRRLVPTIAHG